MCVLESWPVYNDEGDVGTVSAGGRGVVQAQLQGNAAHKVRLIAVITPDDDDGQHAACGGQPGASARPHDCQWDTHWGCDSWPRNTPNNGSKQEAHTVPPWAVYSRLIIDKWFEYHHSLIWMRNVISWNVTGGTSYFTPAGQARAT